MPACRVFLNVIVMKMELIWKSGACVFLIGCVRAQDPGVGAFAAAEWKAVFRGVDHAAISMTVPRPVKVQLLRVKLGTPGLSVVATPDNGEAPGETTGERTTSFLKRLGCQAAVNAGPFDKVTSLEGGPLEVSGLHVSGGKVVSKDNGYPVLLIDAGGRARIEKNPDPTGIKEAVSGFQVVLRDGKTVATDVKLHPRTGAGVSADGKTLWLLVVDGRQVGTSEGCTTVEMAGWLRAMGAEAGVNLDGGGTTTMVLADAEGKPVIINRPIHAGIPGMERPAGSHLGIRAQPLVDPVAGQ